MNSNPILLRMTDISKSFGRTEVLSQVQFDLYPGEVHVLAGENGAGKSTLIKILCGVHTEYKGTIELSGQPVRFSSPQDAAEHGITAIYQELSLVPSMQVADNIFLGRETITRFGSIDRKSQKSKAQDILNRLGLELDIRKPVEEYPISMQQMIEIAKALSIAAKIIVMDEPTSALTEPEVERLFATIETLKQHGCSIIYITHKMEEIYRIADRITVLRDGRYVGTANKTELPRQELIKWMVGREISDQFPYRNDTRKEERFRIEHFSIPDERGRRPIVDDISFTVYQGEILGIAGLQGSGASELLNGIFGSYGTLPTGTLFLDGEPISIKSPRHSINLGIALLTNDRKTTGLVLDMNIAENVTMASIPQYSPGYWFRKRWERTAGDKYRTELDIKSPNSATAVAELSGGNQQKVALSKWIETKPKVLLLDEPTRGIDVGAKYEIYKLMNQWTESGYAIILITSEMPELIALSDRILVLHRGQVTARFNRDEVTQEKILHAAMGE
ncbi:MAG: sugar ABC transporter ATP-binding protein [bacterium]